MRWLEHRWLEGLPILPVQLVYWMELGQSPLGQGHLLLEQQLQVQEEPLAELSTRSSVNTPCFTYQLPRMIKWTLSSYLVVVVGWPSWEVIRWQWTDDCLPVPNHTATPHRQKVDLEFSYWNILGLPWPGIGQWLPWRPSSELPGLDITRQQMEIPKKQKSWGLWSWKPADQEVGGRASPQQLTHLFFKAQF